MDRLRCLVSLAAAWQSLCLAGAAEGPGKELVLDLEQCIAMAMQNHPRMEQAKAGSSAAEANRAEARAAYLPRVDAVAKWERLDEDVSVDAPISDDVRDALIDSTTMRTYAQTFGGAASAFPGGGLPPAGPYQAIRQEVASRAPATLPIPLMGREVLTSGVTLTQPLFTGGKIQHRNRQAEFALRMAREGEALTEHSLRFDVTCAYYAVALGKDLVSVAESSRDRLRVIADITGDLWKTSERVSQMDHLKARIHHAKAEAATAAARKYHQLALARLSESVGLPVATPLGIRDEHLVGRPERRLEFEQCMQQALDARPELRQAQWGVQARRSAVSLALAEFSPDVGLFVQFNHIQDNENYPNPNDENQWVGGIGVTVPLFAGGSNTAKLRRARSELRQAEAFEREARQKVALEVKAALLELEEKRERARAALRASEDAIERNALAKQGFRYDLVKVKDMVEAQFDELEARASYLQGLYEANTADAYVAKALCR